MIVLEGVKGINLFVLSFSHASNTVYTIMLITASELDSEAFDCK